jgi:hypothetical protein
LKKNKSNANIKEEGSKLKKLKLNPFTKEKTLQCLIEQNLLEVLDMHFLATEYPTTFGVE